ncbi:MAG: 2-oxoacid:acceptor oxidoreductase family protein, partial [Cocleimonas sp.]
MALFGKKNQNKVIKYPGIRQLMNGNAAVIMCEKESSDAATVYLSSPNTEMGSGWNIEKDKGHLNISNRPLISVIPEDNNGASAVTAGMSLSGLRATLFSSSTQSIASMHESLYVAVGKRLPIVLNIACKAITKATSNIHCSHDDYHSIDDTGFVQMFARNNQAAADLNVIGRKIAELSLTPIAIAQDGFLTSHLIEPLNAPERELIEEFVGLPDDIINTPTPAQKLLYGKTRRRIPETWSVDQPIQSGATQNPDSYMQTVAGQRPYFFDHISTIAEQCMDEWFELTGRRYHRIHQYKCDGADYLIISQGSISTTIEATIGYLRTEQKLKVGLIDMTLLRPFPGDLLSQVLKGRKGVVVLERTDQPLSADLPIIAEIRTCISKAIDNAKHKSTPFDGYASYDKTSHIAPLYSACYGLGGHEIQPSDIIAAVENMLPDSKQKKFTYLGIDFARNDALSPQQEIQQQDLLEAYPHINDLSLTSANSPTLLPENASTIHIHSLGGWENTLAGQILAQTLFDNFDFEVKAHPDYGTEKNAQPTHFQLTVASEPIPVNCSHNAVNTVISIDPNIFSHSNPLTEMTTGGTLIIQSALSNAKEVWDHFTAEAHRTLIEKQIKIFFIDAISLAQQHITKVSHDTKSQHELQHVVLKSVFFKVCDIINHLEKTEEEIQTLIDDRLDLVKSSFNQVQEIIVAEMSITDTSSTQQHEPVTPLLLQQKPANKNAIASIHRFWNQTGHVYRENKKDLNHQTD